MEIAKYARIAKLTDQLTPKSARHPNYKIIPILGLAGEIGSLLSELKKQVRETNRKSDIGGERIKEELGDIIWYAVTIARRAKLDFARDVLLSNLKRTRAAPNLYIPITDRRKLSRRSRARTSIRSVRSFNTYQMLSAKTAKLSKDDAALLPYLARIWRNSGEILDVVDVSKGAFNKSERQKIAKSLGDVMWYVAQFATLYNLKLDDIAAANVDKAQSMFMPKSKRVPTALHDNDYEALERFPRRFNVDFISVDNETSVMLINGMRVGDPLRDNAYQPDEAAGKNIDGYRFHDCVHWAFVAVLGWSPVMRGLLKRKRKSDSTKDDVDDGARAQIVEEMVIKLAHSHAVHVGGDKLLKGRSRLGMDLLKQIQLITAGLEVDTNRLWEWERAILIGFDMFDKLRRQRQGRLSVDLAKRTLRFRKIGISTASYFPV